MRLDAIRSSVAGRGHPIRLETPGRPFEPRSSSDEAPDRTDTYRRVGDKSRARRLFAYALNRLAGVIHLPSVSYGDFEVMRSLGGTHFYFKQVGDRLVVAGRLSDVAEFVHSLYDVPYRLGREYASLAVVAIVIDDAAQNAGRDSNFLTWGSGSNVAVHVHVRKGLRPEFYELKLARHSLPTADWRKTLRDFALRRESEIETRVLAGSFDDGINGGYTPRGIRRSLAALISQSGARHKYGVMGLLVHEDDLSARPTFPLDEMTEVEVGFRTGVEREITAIVLRFIQRVRGVSVHGDVLNVLEFIGSLDPLTETQVGIVWAAANVASLFVDVDSRRLKPEDLMGVVRRLFDPDILHRIAVPKDPGPQGGGGRSASGSPRASGGATGPSEEASTDDAQSDAPETETADFSAEEGVVMGGVGTTLKV